VKRPLLAQGLFFAAELVCVSDGCGQTRQAASLRLVFVNVALGVLELAEPTHRKVRNGWGTRQLRFVFGS